MGIKVNTEVFNVLKAVMKSGVFLMNEMRQVKTVSGYLRTVKEINTADWIEENEIQYLIGLLQGFEVDNSQDAQLKDIQPKIPLGGQRQIPREQFN